jgi:tRNA pseudouridine38-40 synthase
LDEIELEEKAAPTAVERLEQTTIRTIFSSAWEQRQTEAGELSVYRARGNGFLHHMVRNLVGTMIDVGRGQLVLEEIPGILAARSRSAAGPTAPARGLFLHSVEYDERDLMVEPDGRSSTPSTRT